MGMMIKLVLCTNSLVSDTNFHPMFHSLVELLMAFDLSHCQFNFPEHNDLVLHLSVVINALHICKDLANLPLQPIIVTDTSI